MVGVGERLHAVKDFNGGEEMSYAVKDFSGNGEMSHAVKGFQWCRLGFTKDYPEE